MTMPLLTTKLHIPSPRLDPSTALRANLVPRPCLIERLDEGLRLGRKLTLVSAPPGFGKTTLVAEWLACQTTSHSIAWLSLDEADNDPARFFVYFIAALQQLDENVGQAAQNLLGAPQLPPVASLMTLLIGDIAGFSPFVFVLDDYHLIHTAFIHDAIEFLLNYQPPQMHLCLATRTDPPLFLPRLRVRGQMTEIRADDLRFTAEEAAAFLNQVWGLTLDGDKVVALEARTEGWIAGLQLAALSMRGKKDVAGFIDAFSGSNRHVIDYLAAEVLAQQPDEIRDFLCQTSILDQLTGALCQAVTGKENSAALLRQLEQANLFLAPLDQRGEWYRYHRLFADFLRAELEPQHRAALHLRAARWHEENRLLSQAVEHALASGDVGESVRLIAQVGYWALSECMIATVLGWLDVLPDEVVRANSDLASHKAWALFVTGHIKEACSYVRSVEASLRGVEICALKALALHALDDMPAALAALERSLALAEPEGYVRMYLNEGLPMAALLREIASQGAASNYVNKLLVEFGVGEYGSGGEALTPPHPHTSTLPHPLTPRELDVLRLINDGLSNRQIAEQLVIALNTVKRHTSSIYGKLNVESRTQAIARAREFGLIPTGPA